VPVIEDQEFGPIMVRRSSRSKSMRVSMAPNGTMRVSVPAYAPLFMIKRMIASSRPQLRKLRLSHPDLVLEDGMSIGKSHHLTVRQGMKRSIKRTGQHIILTLKPSDSLDQPDIIALAREQIILALRREAKHYMPKRLEHLARQFGFSYSSVRFSHASGRWGSCNHKQAIALMNLPFELIDYVIIHELAHTKELNHSERFWSLVAEGDPEYRHHRKIIKGYSPAV
jgi:predicted metal-dependent hydrolase